ncbi:MAG: hypothetical protein R3F56_24290 [Planctomycetota bacterium]
MSNPIGFGIAAALALTSAALAGGNDDGVKNNKNEPSTPPQDGVTVTAAPGKGITFRGENYDLNLVNMIQANFGYTGSDSGPDTLGVSIRRARTRLMGSAYKDTVHFVLQFEWADRQTSDINDALITWDLYKAENYEMSLRFGQGKTLFGTEWTGTAYGLEFVDRALATQVFSATRTRQAQLVGKIGGGNLRWNAGLMNGDVAQSSIGAGVEDNNNGGTELNWILGVAYGSGQDKLYGEFREQGALQRADEPMWVANAAISYGANDSNDVGGREYNALSLNGGGAFYTGNLHFLGEVFIRDEDADNTTLAGESTAFGWQASGSYTAEPGPTIQWAYGLRLSGVHVSDYTATGGAALPILVTGLGGEGNILELSAMATAYYFGHNLKTQFGYTFRSFDPDTASVPDPNVHTFEVQSQIVF